MIRSPEVSLVDVGNNVPDRRQPVLVVTSTSLAIATIFVAPRLVSRIGIVKRVLWDDYLIVVGWVCPLFRIRVDEEFPCVRPSAKNRPCYIIAFGLTFSAAYATSKGLGLHNANIPNEWISVPPSYPSSAVT